MDDVHMISSSIKGYNIYVDGAYVGTEGTNGDVSDGNYTVYVSGNNQHSIIADDGKFTYGLVNFPFGDGMPYLFSLDDPQLKLGPSSQPNNIRTSINSDTGLNSPISTTDQNQPPDIPNLSSDPQSPQQVGASITWRATANDPENDPIYYRFSLNGPRTGEQWQVLQDWSTSNSWSWRTEERDIGYSSIRVEIRDGKHADTSDADGFKDCNNYQIIQKQLANLNVQVTNDVYSDRDRTMYYCQDGKYLSFKNRIYLIGPDLDKVKSVKYVLHESFQENPAPDSEDRANNFEMWIMTWGRFPIKAIITTTNGQQFEKDYDFSFKSKVEEAKRMGIPMVMDC